MEMSAEIGEIAAALAKAQAGFEKLIASKTAKLQGKAKGSGREYEYGYTYANLADALETCRATLNANGIAVLQEPATPSGQGIEVTTMLAHSSGQWFRSAPLFMPVDGGAQEVGSAVTYGRRYSLLAMVGLAPEDDDGKAAQAARPNSKPKASSKPDKPAVSQATCSPGMAEANEKRLLAIAKLGDLDANEVWDQLVDGVGWNQSWWPRNPADLSPAQAATFAASSTTWLEKLEKING